MPYPDDPPRWGEIYWVDFNPGRGSEQTGRRPGVVISRDSFNKAMPVVSIAAVSSKIKSFNRIAPILSENDPLPQKSQILAFQVLTVDQKRLDGYCGRLNDQQTIDLKEALRLVWDL
ncbi:type II toxin-antitoxin system PemK/MazF family toxin [Actinomadura opuntiae]|uniref:type II toxin-antitoxin system PemK/MazF family toxin n=1 Tax=Actinomadura sp. OS1-43 TaxID=604315 RepID=UPI00255AA19B|nr:type II toxin-antitoxin system PemK/MazF family toxin [Actinomadura sp. OS1-43]MDL4820917.1 type II toxin-antitoxin system PemK/MazF family toxin [Actinomadura sp. OS1-43]